MDNNIIITNNNNNNNIENEKFDGVCIDDGTGKNSFFLFINGKVNIKILNFNFI